MNLEFEREYREPEAMRKVLFGDHPVEFLVTKNAVPGHIVQLLDLHGDGPITTAMKAYGSLTYGNQRPDLILSSEAMMKRMVRYIVPDQIVPVMYKRNFGFHLCDAIWSHPKDYEIEDGWVFMLNTKEPLNFRLNGCYRMMEG